MSPNTRMYRPTGNTARPDTNGQTWSRKPPAIQPRTIKFAYETQSRCPVCGKRSSKYKVFEERFTPLNRNPDGTIRSEAQILASLKSRASAWRPDFTHQKCKEK